MQPEQNPTAAVELALEAADETAKFLPAVSGLDAKRHLQVLAAEVRRLRVIEEAAELVCGNDMCGIVEDSAWAALRKALGMEVCPT